MNKFENNSIHVDEKSRTITIYHDDTVLPTHISLVNVLGEGVGDLIVNSALAMEESHPNYVNEYGETSAKLYDARFKQGDPTVMYTFGVHKEDLMFHRHAGRRAINGTTGSGGAVLKFSHVEYKDLENDPELFFRNMSIVYLPGDVQFTLKFDGKVSHQFGPRDPQHNAFSAVSVHPQEDQNLSGQLLEDIHNGKASIPILTEPVPQVVVDIMKDGKYVEGVKQVIIGREKPYF